MKDENTIRLQEVIDVASGLLSRAPDSEREIIMLAIETAYIAGKNDALDDTLAIMKQQGTH